MPDAKYGRLFTEADVERIVSEALIRQHSQEVVSKLSAILPHVRDDELTFPADEPLFLLRGQDRSAPDAVWQYGWFATDTGAAVEFVTTVLQASNDMGEWQRANRARVKVPD